MRTIVLPSLLVAVAALPFDNPAWVAGVVAVIGAIALMIGNLLTQLKNGRKLDANTSITEASHAQGAEIKTLVNGERTQLLAKLDASEQALNAARAEIRSLRELLAALATDRRPPTPAKP